MQVKDDAVLWLSKDWLLSLTRPHNNGESSLCIDLDRTERTSAFSFLGLRRRRSVGASSFTYAATLCPSLGPRFETDPTMLLFWRTSKVGHLDRSSHSWRHHEWRHQDPAWGDLSHEERSRVARVSQHQLSVSDIAQHSNHLNWAGNSATFVQGASKPL